MNNSRLIIFILFQFIFFKLNSQVVNIDSLKLVLNKCANDSNKVNTLNALAWELKNSKTNESLSYSLQALNLSKKIKFKTGQTRALSNSGIAYYFQGNYPKALQNYTEAVKLLEGTKYKKKCGALYNNISLIYLELLNYKDAEIYIRKSLAIDEELLDYKGLGDSYNNLGLIYKDQDKNDQALDYFNISLSYRKKANDKVGMPYTLTNMGVLNTGTKNYTIAKEQLNEAINLYSNNGDMMGVSLATIDLGDLYVAQRNYSEAILFFKRSLEISKKEDIKAYMSYCYNLLAKCYSKINGFQQAYFYHVEYMKVKDSIFNKDNSALLAEIQTKYETEKKEKEIIRSRAESEKEHTMKNIFIIGFIVMFILAFFILRGYVIKRKSNKIIIAQKHEMMMQRDIVDAKNKEITDSIQYAKRIQLSLLTNEKYIERNLKRLMEKGME